MAVAKKTTRNQTKIFIRQVMEMAMRFPLKVICSLHKMQNAERREWKENFPIFVWDFVCAFFVDSLWNGEMLFYFLLLVENRGNAVS